MNSKTLDNVHVIGYPERNDTKFSELGSEVNNLGIYSNDAQSTENCYEALKSMRQIHEISMGYIMIMESHGLVKSKWLESVQETGNLQY